MCAVLGGALLVVGARAARGEEPAVTVTTPSGFAVSAPMSQGTPARPTAVNASIPLRRLPPVAAGRLPNGRPDQVVQTEAGAPLEAEEQPLFPGVGANGSAPPDPNLAVGPSYVVQTVNTAYAVYDKNGNLLAGPNTLGSLFNPLGGSCTGQWGDPIVQYDKAADRWLISQMGSFSAPFSECIAVSTTNDPRGTYFLYSYSFGNNLNDYPKIGIWPSSTNGAYTATYNLFANGATFVGASLCAYDRAAMLSGAATPAQVCFTISNDGGFLPADVDGSTPPPAGASPVYMNFETLSSLRYYQLTPNFANPASSTLSAPTDIAVAAFSEACGGGTCIPQSGTSQQLDSLGDRLMYRLAYRNFGDHDALVVNHSVGAGSSVGVRWYELRSPLTEAFALYQQGTFAPDSTYRWMASAAMDQAGDIAIGYSASSSGIFPAIRYTGRAPTDALGTMRAEASMQLGGGSQNGGLSRWGDYTALRIDPSDDCTFWYTNEYEPANGSFNWATTIGSFTIAGCAPPTPDFSLTATPASQTVVQGSATSYTATVTGSGGFTGSVTLVASGLPSGAGASFSPNPVAGGSGSSTMSVTTGAATPAGTYTLTVTGTSGTLTHSTTVTLVVTPPATPDFSLTATPASQTVVQGSATSYTATVTGSGGFTGSVTLVASGLPSGAGASFSPNPVAGGSGSSTMSVTTGAATPAGTYTLTVTGTSGTLTHSTTVTLVVTPPGPPDFGIAASPASRTVTRGSSTTYTVTVTALNGFTGTVTFSVSGLPPRTSASFNPTSVTGGGSSTLTVGTRNRTPRGTYTLTIRGTSGALTHAVTVQLIVQ